MGKSYSPILEYSDYLDAAISLSLLELVAELSRKLKQRNTRLSDPHYSIELAWALNFLKEVFQVFNTVRCRLMSVLFRTMNWFNDQLLEFRNLDEHCVLRLLVFDVLRSAFWQQRRVIKSLALLSSLAIGVYSILYAVAARSLLIKGCVVTDSLIEKVREIIPWVYFIYLHKKDRSREKTRRCEWSNMICGSTTENLKSTTENLKCNRVPN